MHNLPERDQGAQIVAEARQDFIVCRLVRRPEATQTGRLW
jgi:hypothetical protein